MKALRLSILLSTLFAISIAATQAFAQERNTVLADELLRQAQFAEDQASNSEGADFRWEAARLHLESAKLRGADDPQAVVSMRTAGLYLAYSRPARAAEVLVEAAQRALAMDDYVTAANIYVDAAEALIGPGRRTSATEFARAQSWVSQAATISTLPQISEVERDRIFRRIGLEKAHFAG